MSSPEQIIIGVDFDNTIASYDEGMHSIALELGLIQPETPKIKKEVRDAIRNLPNGELRWQGLQGIVYGPRMHEAQVSEGCLAFFQEWADKGAKLHIVSHKTEFANYDETHTSLRQAAMGWLEKNGFLNSTGGVLAQADVFWESTRIEKVKRIAQLGCSHFIDDLEEVFADPDFPVGLECILYAPKFDPSHSSTLNVAKDWNQVTGYVSSGSKAQVPGI